MISVFLILVIYILGGVTLPPLLALLSYYCLFQTNKNSKSNAVEHELVEENVELFPAENGKKVQRGWVRLTNQYQPKMPEGDGKIMSGIHSIVSQGASKPKGMFYAVLINKNLVCYESEKQQYVLMTLDMKEYQVSLYPKVETESEIYGRVSVIRLVPKALMKEVEDEDAQNKPIIPCTLSDEDITHSPTRVLFLNCSRKMDKEDWYFGILDAQNVIQDPTKSAQYIMVDNTHFSPTSMDVLIRQVQSSQSHRDIAWLNALLGRIFLAMYKTDELKEKMVQKLRKKLDKTRRPTFLDEIIIRSVDIGESVPFITDPKLISLTPQGEVIIEANVDYHGGYTIEIGTGLNWSYSSLLKPIRMELILAAKLKKLTGKLMIKLKAPPSNRCWYGFFEMPEMEWKITPVVADKQIKWSLVTNAIEAKIREVMLETFVLPNMDDTPFCLSDGAGGIFGEYVMKPKQATHSRSSSISSFVSTSGSIASSTKPPPSYENTNGINTDSGIKESPSVPETHDKVKASEALKLNSRRAESMAEINFASNSTNTEPDTTPVSDSTQSLHTLHRANTESVNDHSQTQWSSTTLRKRNLNNSNEREDENSTTTTTTAATATATATATTSSINDHTRNLYRVSDSSLETSSIRSVSTHGSVHSSGVSTSSLLSKKKGLLSRAENYIHKRMSSGPDYTPLENEKREQYAERLAQMRHRSIERSLNGNSLNSLVKPEINAKEPGPPTPPLPPRYEENEPSSLDNKSIKTEIAATVPPPLPSTPRPNLAKTKSGMI